MNGIYDFLQIDRYEHNFDKIEKKEVDYDERINDPANMHEVRLKLEKTSTDPKTIFSDYVISKYGNGAYDIF
jgi:hypothetical protein